MSQLNSTNPTSKAEPGKPGGNTALLAVAISLGVVAALANIYYLNAQAERFRTETFTVYRVTRSFDAGEKIKMKDLSTDQLPKTVEESFANAVPKESIENYLNIPLRRPIRQSEILTWDVFTGTSTSEDMGIRSGYAAVGLPVNKETAPISLEPNAYIDITAMVRAPGKEPTPMLILEKVRVVQVGNRVAGDEIDSRRRLSSYSQVMVEVKPEEDLTLKALRNYMDDYEFDIRMRYPGDDLTQIKTGGVNPEVLALLGSK